MSELSTGLEQLLLLQIVGADIPVLGGMFSLSKFIMSGVGGRRIVPCSINKCQISYFVLSQEFWRENACNEEI
jgi:hypothetical protein